MPKTYFELLDDLHLQGRWYLNGLFDGAGTHLDAREFTYGKPLELGPPLRTTLWNEDKVVDAQAPLRVMLDKKRMGAPLDFTFTNDNMPVATTRVGDVVADIAGAHIQRVSVCVESQRDEFEIINITSRIECIDKDLSEIQWFEEGNTIRPDLAGEPEMITKLIIDADRVNNEDIFRPQGWDLVIIVSNIIKNAFEEMDVSGVTFRKVTP